MAGRVHCLVNHLIEAPLRGGNEVGDGPLALSNREIGVSLDTGAAAAPVVEHLDQSGRGIVQYA